MTRTEAQVAGAWRGAGLPAKAIAEIFRHYAEPHRAYHNLAHIKAVLDMIAKLEQPSPELVAAAILHDVIYDPRRSDNEEQSAALAHEILGETPLSVDRVKEMILLTKSHHLGGDLDLDAGGKEEAEALLDADLAVLGGYEQDYDSYARAIRLEYWHVEPEAYREGRRKVLEGFLARPRIFRLAENFEIYEETARANLRRELSSLS